MSNATFNYVHRWIMNDLASKPDSDAEMYFRWILTDLGYKTPIITTNRECKLIHVCSFDIDSVVGVVGAITTDYVIEPMKHLSCIVCMRFGQRAPFDAVLIALKLEFGEVGREKNLPF